MTGWHHTDPVRVEEGAVARFAAAVGDHEADMPWTYPVVLGWQAQGRAMRAVLPEHDLGLHGEHAFEFLRPLTRGSWTHSRSRLERVRPRRTGTAVVVRTETRDEHQLCVVQWCTIFVVGRELPAYGATDDAQQPAPTGEPELLDTVEDVVPLESLAAYASASGDSYPIHLDDAAARGLGLPGRIVHGMCTLAHATRALRTIAAGRGYTTPRRLEARFSAPLLPDVTFRTVVSQQATPNGAIDLAFESLVGATPILTRGRAVVAR